MTLQRQASLIGCTLRRTGNLIQVVKQGMGTVYQHHSEREISSFLANAPRYLSVNEPQFGNHFRTDDNIVARKYGRVTARP